MIYDLIIVGGGAAGMLCAINSKKANFEKVLLIEKDVVLGGALNLIDYNISERENLSGKTYKKELLNKYNELNISTYLNTLVLSINDCNNIVCVSPERGVEELKSKNIILANGAKEKARNFLSMVGDRCAGVITLRNAKKILDIDNMIPGKEIVLYGDKNLKLIKDDLKKKNLKIKAIVGTDLSKESKNICSNIYEGFEITKILGKNRVDSVILTKDNENLKINCDTVILAQDLLSDGLVSFRSNISLNPATTGPKVNDNLETSRKNIFACGDGIYIHNTIKELEDEVHKLILHISSL